ncbi:MAG: hypothetical protein ACJA04_000648 [Cellvibrionaceae bacterium]
MKLICPVAFGSGISGDSNRGERHAIRQLLLSLRSKLKNLNPRAQKGSLKKETPYMSLTIYCGQFT